MSREHILQEKLNFRGILSCIVNSLLNRSKGNGGLLVSLPTSIGGYRLIHPILEGKEPKFYQFGIYQNLKGERAIAKQWIGKIKNTNYYWLLNEINVYQGVWYLYKKNTQLRKRYPHIHFPKLLAVRKKSDRLIMLLEEVKGKSLEALEVSARIPVYEEVISFFQELGGHLEAPVSKIFKKRNAWVIGILFLIHLMRAILKHPKYLPSLGKATALFIIRFPKLVRDKDVSLVHRDLMPANIFVKGKEIQIIDLQLLCITHRILEVVAINLGRWKNPLHWHFFKSTKTMEKVFSNPHSLAVYQALALYLSIFNLANTYSIPHKVAHDYLKYWLKPPIRMSNK